MDALNCVWSDIVLWCCEVCVSCFPYLPLILGLVFIFGSAFLPVRLFMISIWVVGNLLVFVFLLYLVLTCRGIYAA